MTWSSCCPPRIASLASLLLAFGSSRSRTVALPRILSLSNESRRSCLRHIALARGSWIWLGPSCSVWGHLAFARAASLSLGPLRPCSRRITFPRVVSLSLEWRRSPTSGSLHLTGCSRLHHVILAGVTSLSLVLPQSFSGRLTLARATSLLFGPLRTRSICLAPVRVASLSFEKRCSGSRRVTLASVVGPPRSCLPAVALSCNESPPHASHSSHSIQNTLARDTSLSLAPRRSRSSSFPLARDTSLPLDQY